MTSIDWGRYVVRAMFVQGLVLVDLKAVKSELILELMWQRPRHGATYHLARLGLTISRGDGRTRRKGAAAMTAL